jgi:hypothetical protein
MLLEAMSRCDVMGGPCEHGAVTPEEEAAMAEALRKAARADRRIDAAKERSRQELRDLILEAASKGMRPSKIIDSIEHRYTDAHVSRMIHGKA